MNRHQISADAWKRKQEIIFAAFNGSFLYIDLWSRYVEYAWRVFIGLKVKINYCLEIIQAHSIRHSQLNHIFHCFPASAVQTHTHTHTRQLPVIQLYPIPHSPTSALWPPSAVQSAVIYVTTSDLWQPDMWHAEQLQPRRTSAHREHEHADMCVLIPVRSKTLLFPFRSSPCHVSASNKRAFVLKLFLTWRAYASYLPMWSIFSGAIYFTGWRSKGELGFEKWFKTRPTASICCNTVLLWSSPKWGVFSQRR